MNKHPKLAVNAFGALLVLVGCVAPLPDRSHSYKVEAAQTTGTDLTQEVVSIKALRNKQYSAKLNFEKQIYQLSGYDGSLYSYQSDGLKVYALVNKPSIEPPKNGFPVLIFGHGLHPQPANYGVTKDGVVSRPGDYYRGIPESFAKRGFVVVSPDYRGHNVSQGFRYTQTSYLASSFYASDVLHAVAGLETIEQVNLNRIYYLGHSMGGEVGLKVLLATNRFKAASLWSPVVAETDVQALYYGKYDDEVVAPDDSKVDDHVFAQYRDKITKVYAEYASGVSTDDVDPIQHVQDLATPLMIQHARGDAAVPYAWSQALVVKLINAGKDVSFHTYNTDNHLFNQENMQKAINRDTVFFNTHQ